MQLAIHIFKDNGYIHSRLKSAKINALALGDAFMAADYELNDQDRADLVKNFFRRYGYIVLAVLVVIAVGIGIRAYLHNHAAKQNQAASIAYQALLSSIHNNAKPDVVAAAAKQLIKDYPHTVYASFAELSLANIDINANNLSSAERELRTALAQNKANTLAPIITLRLARVLLGENEPNQALALLKNPPKGYEAAYGLLSGDAYVALNNSPLALANYQAALKAAGSDPMLTQLLQTRINNLNTKS